MSRWRLAAVVAIGIGAMFGPQILLLLGLHFGSWLVPLGVLTAGVTLVTVLIVTAPRTQGGKGLLIFASGQVTLMPLSKTPAATRPTEASIRLCGDERVELKRLSNAWARLRLVRPDRTVTFQAGVRSPVETHAEFVDAINETIAQARSRSTGPVPQSLLDTVESTPRTETAVTRPPDPPPTASSSAQDQPQDS